MIFEYNVKKFCCEDISLIENYDEAINSKQKYDCHHKLEIELNKTKQELIDMGLYWKRPASELIFMTPSEHHLLHAKYSPVSDETRKKQSNARKKIYEDPEERRKTGEKTRGEKNGMYGRTHTTKAKERMSEASRKYWQNPENKQKLIAKRTTKHKYLTPTGDIKYMTKIQASRYHKDWKLID